LDVEAPVPSACRAQAGVATSEHKKIVTDQTACRSSPEEAKKYFAKAK
jgi:hypothetical protein